jgi:hypothetical protein
MQRQFFSLFFAAGVFLIPSLVAAQNNRPRLESAPRASRIVSIPAHDSTTTNEARTQAAEFRQIDIADETGHRGSIVLIYESVSGVYWWSFQGTQKTETSDIVDPFLKSLRPVMNDKHLYVFGFSGHALEVREESGQAASIADAQTKAIDELNTRWNDIQSGAWFGTRFIDLSQTLGMDFFFLQGSEAVPPPPAVRSIVHSGQQWVVTLDGPNQDAAQVTLDDSFNVKGATSVPGNSKKE